MSAPIQTPASGSGRPLVLVVDDEPELVELMQTVLGREFDVVTAGDGTEALEVLRTHPVRAIVTDQQMPGMMGTEFLSTAIAIRPHAARILITGTDRVEDVRDAVNVAQVSRFLSKPVRPMEVLAIVRGAIRETELEAQNASLLVELKEKNEQLRGMLEEVRAHERKLEVEVVRRTKELRQVVQQLEQLALRDGLTGLFNHRYFQEALVSELGRAHRHQRVVGLVFIDVDHFKTYNDTHGHLFGDELLKQLSRILGNTGAEPDISIRGRISDVVCRYGGEEFVLILPEADKEGAAIRAERIRAAVAAYPFEGGDKQPGGKVTISVGVAAYPQDGTNKQTLLQAADDAMFRAKRAGRNRVCLAGED